MIDVTEDLHLMINTALRPLIDRDYWLMEVPHYDNVGDTLIWQGEMDFLHETPFNCKGTRALDSTRKADIKPNDLVLFQGGGNFGDLWPRHHNFKMNVIAEHPHNKFIFFPQTVWFQDAANLQSCAEFLSHYDVTICARDNMSYNILNTHFKNKILLVPDMAFCMNMSKWNVSSTHTGRPLMLKRGDKEFKPSDAIDALIRNNDIDVTDWPTMTERHLVNYGIDLIWSGRKLTQWLYDSYMYYLYRPYCIRSGINLISSHTKIFTTRLHACILSLLLKKDEIVFFENTYGKNSSFYDTWLKDCPNVTMER